MNFNGHLGGAATVGLTIDYLAYRTGLIDVGTQTVFDFLSAPLERGGLQKLAALWIITVFMGIFPDLDTASVPQRWFFRVVAASLISLHFSHRHDLLALVAIASILPLLHQHRGWTHWKITPWIMTFFLAVVYEYYRATDSWFSSFSWHNVLEFHQEYWIYILAGILGHYSHLALDSKKVRRFLSGRPALNRHH